MNLRESLHNLTVDTRKFILPSLFASLFALASGYFLMVAEFQRWLDKQTITKTDLLEQNKRQREGEWDDWKRKQEEINKDEAEKSETRHKEWLDDQERLFQKKLEEIEASSTTANKYWVQQERLSRERLRFERKATLLESVFQDWCNYCRAAREWNRLRLCLELHSAFLGSGNPFFVLSSDKLAMEQEKYENVNIEAVDALTQFANTLYSVELWYGNAEPGKPMTQGFLHDLTADAGKREQNGRAMQAQAREAARDIGTNVMSATEWNDRVKRLIDNGDEAFSVPTKALGVSFRSMFLAMDAALKNDLERDKSVVIQKDPVPLAGFGMWPSPSSDWVFAPSWVGSGGPRIAPRDKNRSGNGPVPHTPP